MNILVVNGSPRGANGNTTKLTDAFLTGAHAAGAESEMVYLKDKHIEHCTGCFSCWTQTPGVCINEDDMPALLEKVQQADLLLLATPLYIYTVTGLMKDFMDRCLPSIQPFIDLKDGICGHPARDGSKVRPVVLISNCGFIEQAHFSGLKETFRRCYRDRLAGMICCAGGELLKVPEWRDGVSWYLDAVQQGGQEVVTQGRISSETQAILERPLMADQELFVSMANESWKNMGIQRIGEEECTVTPSDTTVPNNTLLPPPSGINSMSDMVAGMALVFNPVQAGSLCAVIQFVVTDETPGHYYLEIADGACRAYAGEHPQPTATITTPGKVWMGIVHGEINAAIAFLTGKCKAKGDMNLLRKMQKLFTPAK